MKSALIHLAGPVIELYLVLLQPDQIEFVNRAKWLFYFHPSN